MRFHKWYFLIVYLNKNQPKRLDYKNSFLKLAYFDNLSRNVLLSSLLFTFVACSFCTTSSVHVIEYAVVTSYFLFAIALMAFGRLVWLTSCSSFALFLFFVLWLSSSPCISGTSFVSLLFMLCSEFHVVSLFEIVFHKLWEINFFSS